MQKKEKKYHMYQEPDSSRGHRHIVHIHTHTYKRTLKSHREDTKREDDILSSHTETYRNKSRHMKLHFKRAAERPKGLR